MLDCQRWEKVRFVAASLCSLVKDGKKYDLLPPGCAQRGEEIRFVNDGKKYDLLPPVCAQRREEVRFVATSLRCSIVKDGKKFDLLPQVCARVSEMGSTICCHQLVLDCQRWEEVRFVATSLCSKMGRSAICCHQFVLKGGKKYDLLPPF